MAEGEIIKEGESNKDEILTKNLKSKQNKQLMLIIILMVVIFLSLFVPYIYNFIMKNYVNDFEYNGIKFYKTSIGKLVFYESDIPIINDKNETVSTYTVRFKTDPRELGKIPVDYKIERDRLKFRKNDTVYISMNSSMNNCSDNNIALFDFSAFLGDSGLEVSPAFTDRTYANESGYPYRDCQHSSRNTIIKIDSGNKTEIIRERTNCYKIIYNECEIIPALERFNLRIIEDYMNSTKKTGSIITNNQTINESDETENIE